jgi:hypothetical protein
MPDSINVGTHHWPQPRGFEHRAWTAWYEDDEPDDFGNMPFACGSTKQGAIRNLLRRFPKEEG